MGESARGVVEGCRIVILGSGNVASHFARSLKKTGCDICQVYSRSQEHAERLAGEIGAEAISDLSSIATDADFYIISTVDSAVAEVAVSMPEVAGIVVHTSGSVPMDVLRCASARVGVMYPLQSFSRDRELDMSRVPFFNEASDEATLQDIDVLAALMSGSVHHADSSTRPYLHVAGVLGCNFPNFLLGCAAEVLSRGGFGLDVLRPLLEETVDKAFAIGPEKSQTGPARRGDIATIKRHENMLSPEVAAIYRLLSESIINKYQE